MDINCEWRTVDDRGLENTALLMPVGLHQAVHLSIFFERTGEGVVTFGSNSTMRSLYGTMRLGGRSKDQSGFR